MYVATSLFLAVGAFNSQNNLLYWSFGVAVCAVLVGGVVSGGSLMRLEVRREPTQDASAGDTLTLRYTVRNGHRLLPVMALVIEEISPIGSNHRRRIDPGCAVVAHCGPREAVIVSAHGHALTRGEVKLDRIRVTTSFPFGLVRKVIEFTHPDTLLVLPPVVRVRRELVRGVQAGARLDGRASTQTGVGEEFYGLRSYTPGDPMHRIAWRRSAALGTLLVRQTSLPAEPRVWIELDPRMGVEGAHEPVDVERAIAAAAALAGALIESGRAVGLRASWAGLWLTPGPGRVSLARILVALARLNPAPAGALPGRPSLHASGASVLVSIGSPSPTHAPNTQVDGSDIASWAADPSTLPAALAAAHACRRREPAA